MISGLEAVSAADEAAALRLKAVAIAERFFLRLHSLSLLRYDELQEKAHSKDETLRYAADLAERLHAEATPLDAWLGGAEKRLVALGVVSVPCGEDFSGAD